MLSRLHPATRQKFLELGFDPDLRHYGLVQWYDPNMWVRHGELGKGRVKVWVPYAAQENKWRFVHVYPVNITKNKFTNKQDTRAGDLIGFDLGMDFTGPICHDVIVIRQDQTENQVIVTVTKAYDAMHLQYNYRPPGFFPGDAYEGLSREDLAELNMPIVPNLDYFPLVGEEELPTIQKAPDP